MSENELPNYPTSGLTILVKSIKFEPKPKEVENNQPEGEEKTENEEKKEVDNPQPEEAQQSVDLPPLPTILSTKITLDCPLNMLSYITTYGEEEPSIFISQELPPIQQVITTDESMEMLLDKEAELNIYTEVLNEENSTTIQPVSTTTIPMNLLIQENKYKTITINNYNSEEIYNLIIEIEFELEEDLVNYIKNYRIMNLIDFTVLNPPEELTKKYKLVKPKEDPKKKAPPVEAANDKNYLATKSKVEKDNEKLQFCITFYLPSSKQRLITIEGGFLKPQEDYTWIICFNNVPKKLFLSALSVAKFKDMIFSCAPLMIHFYRKEFKDKKKDWDIVETSFGCCAFDLSSLSTPGTTQYKSQLPLEADQTIPTELFPAPPPTPAKGKPGDKDRKSRVSTTSKASKSGEKVDASKSSVIPPAVNPYEGSILTIEMEFNEPLYLPLPPPLESILKPQDVIPSREPLKPIEKTKEATFTIQGEIRSILDIIVNEFIQTQSEYEDPITPEKLREDVMERIKEKGLPKEFDDRLKRAAVALVNERYKDSELDNSGFIGDIYVYLNQQLMNILNEKFPDANQPKVPTESDISISVKQADLLNRYMDLAQESELVQDIASANNYYLNRITYLPDHPSLWYEYGVYLLKEGNKDRAAECFRKTLQYDNTHLLCLINYSALLISRKVYDEAEETLLHTLNLENNNVSLECYLLLCVLYDRFKAKTYFEDYFKRTLDTFDNEYALHYTTGRLLCSLRIYDLAEEAYIRAGYELIGSENIPTIMEYNLSYSIVLYELHKYEEAAKLLEDVITNDTTNQVAYEYLGYCLMEIDLNLELAITHFVTAMKLCEDRKLPIPLQLIYKLNICYQQNGNFDKAKELLIKQCNIMPNSVFWLNIGICCIHMNEIPEAEEALCEANVLNNENGTIWGYLCYLSLLQSPPKFAEAEQALEHAQRFGLNNTDLLMNLTICYYKNDQFTIAERLVRQLLVYDRNPDIIELAKEILRNLGKDEEAERLESEYQPKEEHQQQYEQEEQPIENQENGNNDDENKKMNNDDDGDENENVKNKNDTTQLQQEIEAQQNN